MRGARFVGLFVAALASFVLGLAHAGELAPDKPAPIRKPFGIEKREAWTTGNLHGTPDPPDPYTTENAFPRLKFFEPLSVGLMPITRGASGQTPPVRRFGVATRPGKIYTFEIRPDVEQADLLLDIGKTVYGMAFHPRFATNGYVYVAYVLGLKEFNPKGSRLSRFTVEGNTGGDGKRGPPPVVDPASEQVILEWPSGGHNGGCIRFGPDGFLYLATGDGSGIADGLLTGQDTSDLLGSILRIDVDYPEPGYVAGSLREPDSNSRSELATKQRPRPYSIPPDNPFVRTPGARGEIWSFGHRQVWKFSFDQDRRLWAGEVGQDLWEMVYLVERGGNYGWSVNEGRHPFRPERKRGPGEFRAPLVEHPHSDFRSVTGGFVSRSDRLPELKGVYIYGDYDTGKLWSLRYDGTRVTDHRQLADTQIRIVEFAMDAAGEVYVVDFASGGLHRIVPAPPQAAATKPFPRKLSETGLFASTKDHTPAPGLIPYSVNAPLWSDGAEKERFLALPGDSQIGFDEVVYPHGPNYADLGWRFPDGTVLVKTFALDTKMGDPTSRKRLETRLLQYRKMPGNDDEYGAQLWLGYTYVWNDEQTDAELLASEGLDRKLMIEDAAAPGGRREQVWHFPSRAECALCHTMASKYALGLTTLQMNKDHDYGGAIANQIATLQHLGVFKVPIIQSTAELPRLVDYRDTSEDLHLRARAYLHANCAHCHRQWGGGNAEFDLQASIPLTQTKALDTRPGQGTFQLADPRILVPGDPTRSLIYQRMQLPGLGRMPHIASKVIDTESADLLRAWITSLSDASLLTRPGAINARKAEEVAPTERK